VKHPSETDLILFAFDRSAVARPEEIEAHLLAGCTECERAISFSRSLDDDLDDPDVWERTIGSATLASLRRREVEIAKEDEDAATLLDALLSRPAAAARIDWRQKRFRFGGVVRYLCNRAHSICESKPLDALIFADGAAAVADLLDEDSYVAGGVHELRGVASKERANALRLLGRFDEAHQALDRAEQAFGRLKVARSESPSFSSFALRSFSNSRSMTKRSCARSVPRKHMHTWAVTTVGSKPYSCGRTSHMSGDKSATQHGSFTRFWLGAKRSTARTGSLTVRWDSVTAISTCTRWRRHRDTLRAR